jgi:dTDP-glucose 4,6-dehydratase
LGGISKIKLGATAPTRDFTFVADTAAGLIAGLEAGDESVGQVIQLGTGHEIAIGELARLIAEEAGCEIEIETEAARVRPAASEVERLLANPAKAARLLAWNARLSGREGLRQGIRETLAWFRQPGRLAGYSIGRYQI